MDQILYWNDVALEANRISHTDGKDVNTLGPTLSSRALAIVHLAMYDAYVGAAKATTGTSLNHYSSAAPAAASGTSVAAAIAAAAHTALSALYPSMKTTFDIKYAYSGATEAGTDAGFNYGVNIAKLILADRQNDPSDTDAGYVPPIGRGKHRIDPDNAQGYNAPFYGAASKCFSVSVRHGLDAPPAVGSTEYERALKQVRVKGIAQELMGTLPSNTGKRTVDETLIGIYWGYDGAKNLGTPPRLYNLIVRKVAVENANTLEQNAQLFAMLNTAMGDAGILAWQEKYKYNIWRPILGIREQDKSMGFTGEGNNNIDNDCDPLWLPLGAPKDETGKKNFTPPFPAYPSGHATFGAAAFHITRMFYGVAPNNRTADAVFNGLNFVSDEFNGITKDNNDTTRPRHVRNFPKGLWQMIEENGFSRVYLGVHWSFDAFALDGSGKPDLSKNIGGVPLGLKIAEDIFNNKLTKSSV